MERYGESKGQYPVREPNLDGPGGIDRGTLFYKVLSGGAWSNQVQLNESEQGQVSWFATLTPSGAVQVFWTQGSFEALRIAGYLSLMLTTCAPLRSTELRFLLTQI